ncbi:MAG: hypothetical protein KUG77_12600 [Nannocystaceae bacterium]|nr:hypothetical protein [Nannocystaceae bacterium]
MRRGTTRTICRCCWRGLPGATSRRAVSSTTTTSVSTVGSSTNPTTRRTTCSHRSCTRWARMTLTLATTCRRTRGRSQAWSDKRGGVGILGLVRRLGILATVALGACSFDTAYVCAQDQQCALRSEGQCEADGWCSYPAQRCEGGRAYGPYAPSAIADACVEPTESSEATGSSTSGPAESSSSGEDPVAACGNGVLEDGESCDDGNNEPGDGCHPLCVEPYEPAWTQSYNAQDRDDRGFALAIDEAADALYLCGFTTSSETSGHDLLVQRYGLSDGTRSWTWSRDTAGQHDTAEHLVVDGNGDVVVVGVVTNGAGTERGWVSKFDPAGDMLWEQLDPLASKIEGVAIGDDGRIVAVGRSGDEGGSMSWQQWYASDGSRDGEAQLEALDAAGDNRGIDVINVPGIGVQVTGVKFEGGVPNLWSARYDSLGTALWQHLVPDPDGDVPRGVGQALNPLGGSAVAGVQDTDIFVQFYDELGTPLGDPFTHGAAGQDEAADIAFLDDGRYVVVGFLGFNLQDTGTADGWIRFNEPDGTEIRTYPVSGTGGGIDKVLAVDVAPYSVIVTGYVKNEGTDIDLWLRRYAV